MTEVVNGVTHTTKKSAITLNRMYAASYQKEGTITAEIKQVVETTSLYPSKRVETNMQENLFAASEFGFEPKPYVSTETRIAWIPVPSDIKESEVQERLAKAFANGGTIYRVLANCPILDDAQQYAIGAGLKTKDEFANSQVVRYPDNVETQLSGKANKLILDKAGNPQYRRTFFFRTAQADKDVRGHVDFPVYLSAEIEAELKGASVMAGQTI